MSEHEVGVVEAVSEPMNNLIIRFEEIKRKVRGPTCNQMKVNFKDLRFKENIQTKSKKNILRRTRAEIGDDPRRARAEIRDEKSGNFLN